jgi:DNA-binding LacI/PurR family transcriptional regulator
VIDLRMKEIGKRSVEMLMRLLQTPHENNVYEKITLAPKLIESTYNRHHKKS